MALEIMLNNLLSQNFYNYSSSLVELDSIKYSGFPKYRSFYGGSFGKFFIILEQIIMITL